MNFAFDTRKSHWLLNDHEQKELYRALAPIRTNSCYIGMYGDTAFYRALTINDGNPSTDSKDYRLIKFNIKQDLYGALSNYIIIDMISKKIFTDVIKLKEIFPGLSFSSKCSLEFHETSYDKIQLDELIETILPRDCPESRKRRLSSDTADDYSTEQSNASATSSASA